MFRRKSVYELYISVIHIDDSFSIEKIGEFTCNEYGVMIEENLSVFSVIR